MVHRRHNFIPYQSISLVSSARDHVIVNVSVVSMEGFRVMLWPSIVNCTPTHLQGINWAHQFNSISIELSYEFFKINSSSHLSNALHIQQNSKFIRYCPKVNGRRLSLLGKVAVTDFNLTIPLKWQLSYGHLTSSIPDLLRRRGDQQIRI